MKLRTVNDLKTYLAKNSLSPEAFAKQVKISGMTVRRWLEQPSSRPIPEKYHANLDLVSDGGVSSFELAAVLQESGSSFGQLLSDLEESGRKCQDLEQLRKDTKEKFKDKKIGQELRAQVTLVLESVFSRKLPLKYKAICIGAILYFINPFDLIPDAIPVVGYLDDFAVLTLVAGLLVKHASSQKPGDFTPPQQ